MKKMRWQFTADVVHDYDVDRAIHMSWYQNSMGWVRYP